MKTAKPTVKTADLFSRERYEDRRGEIRLHMSHFFLRYLSDIYQAFEGDLAMAIILGEISHHNTCRFFSPEAGSNESMRELQRDPAWWDGMAGCNAFSVSCATGIPRETVRRKIGVMKRRGWLEEMPKKGLRITQACADHFGADFSLRFLNGMLRASRRIEALLGEDESAEKAPATMERRPAKDFREPKSKQKAGTHPKLETKKRNLKKA
jgi:hypothetical protein